MTDGRIPKTPNDDLVERAHNIQWTVSERYDWQPISAHQTMDGTLDLYQNAVAGATHLFYDEALLSVFRSYLRDQHPEAAMFEELLALSIESGCALRMRTLRPAYDFLRKQDALRIRHRFSVTAPQREVEALQLGHAERILGEVPKLSPFPLRLLNALEALAPCDTEELIERFHQLLRERFHFNPSLKAQHELKAAVEKKKLQRHELGTTDDESEIEKQFAIESAEFTTNVYLDDAKRNDERERPFPLSQKEKNEQELRRFIEAQYGQPFLPERHLRQLELSAAVGMHEKARLLVTDGTLPETATDFRRRLLREAAETNRLYAEERRPQVHRAITRLRDRILNTILNELDDAFLRDRSGDLVAGLVWKTLHTTDGRVFIHRSHEEPGTLCVDLLLDASASQQDRQSSVALQGYILARSLQECRIPVRACSFQSQQGYTILRQYLDYSDQKNADRLFEYFPDAANRDGFALRVLQERMKDRPKARHALIVLSDGKPFDERAGVNTRRFDKSGSYSGERAIDDAARAVRRIRQEGSAVLGVFTGEEVDLPAAHRIYGHSFVYVKKTERFADIVSTFLRAEIKNAV